MGYSQYPSYSLEYPHVYDVLDYGAHGDGASDDTKAIQAAITAATSTSGGTVFIPPGVYRITSTLTLSSPGVTLLGTGTQATIIRPSTGFSSDRVINITANFCGVSDLQISYANQTASSNPGADGIQVTGVTGTLLRNLYMVAINGWTVQSTGGASQANQNTVMHNVRSYLCAKGFHLLGVSGSSYNGLHFLTDCYANQVQSGDCYFIEDFKDLVATNIFGETAAGSGNAVHIKGACASIYFSNVDLGPYPGPATGAVVLIESGANGTPTQIGFNGGIIEGGNTGVTVSAGTLINLTDCKIYNNGTHGLNLTGGDSITVKGCMFNGSGATAGSGHYDINSSTSNYVLIDGCDFTTPQGTGAGQVASVGNITNGSHVYFVNNAFHGSGFSGNIFNNYPANIRNNLGLNPLGSITPPTITASPCTPAAQSFDMTVYIKGGTVSAIAVGGVATGLTLATGGFVTVRVLAQQTITITYSVTPTWTWFGD